MERPQLFRLPSAQVAQVDIEDEVMVPVNLLDGRTAARPVSPLVSPDVLMPDHLMTIPVVLVDSAHMKPFVPAFYTAA